MKGFPDLEKLATKFYRVQAKLRHSAQLVDCVKIYNMISTLQGLCQYLEESVMDEQHPMRLHILDPLSQNLEEFANLKKMLEDCIDISKARQNDYIINPNFSEELGQLDQQVKKVKNKMNQLRESVEDDLNVKKVTLEESNRDGYCFETDKKGADNGMRKSKNVYKVLSMNKGGKTTFTC